MTVKRKVTEQESIKIPEWPRMQQQFAITFSLILQQYYSIFALTFFLGSYFSPFSSSLPI